MLIIIAVLVIAGLGSLWYYGMSKSTPASNTNTAVNKANTAAKTNTVPANAPPGAQPPNQVGSPTASVTLEEFADFLFLAQRFEFFVNAFAEFEEVVNVGGGLREIRRGPGGIGLGPGLKVDGVAGKIRAGDGDRGHAQ